MEGGSGHCTVSRWCLLLLQGARAGDVEDFKNGGGGGLEFCCCERGVHLEHQAGISEGLRLRMSFMGGQSCGLEGLLEIDFRATAAAAEDAFGQNCLGNKVASPSGMKLGGINAEIEFVLAVVQMSGHFGDFDCRMC